MTSIDDLLKLDPLLEAERITGKSYKEDEATSNLGLAMHLLHSANKREVLARKDDTHFGLGFEDGLRIYGELGFEEIHRRAFGKADEERYVVLWHQGDAILATIESYGSTGLNTTKIYFNWEADSSDLAWKIPFSGGCRDRVVVGNMDAREGLRHRLSFMRLNGVFLDSWVEKPFLWFADYTQKRGSNYKQINSEVIATFPESVRKAIGA